MFLAVISSQSGSVATNIEPCCDARVSVMRQRNQQLIIAHKHVCLPRETGPDAPAGREQPHVTSDFRPLAHHSAAVVKVRMQEL